MGGAVSIASSVVTQLVIPVVATNIVSEVKKRAVIREAEVIVGIIEERIKYYARSLHRMNRRKTVVFPVGTMNTALAEARTLGANPRPEKVGVIATKAALAIANFLIRYPEAERGDLDYKDLVCDLFLILSDVVPLASSIGFSDDIIQMIEFGISQVTALVENNNSEEAAKMFFLGIQELCSNSAILETLNDVQ